MIVRKVRVSSKGRVTLPAEVLRALRIKKGTNLLLLHMRNQLVLVPAAELAALSEDLAGWDALAAKSFDELWSSREDKIWDDD